MTTLLGLEIAVIYELYGNPKYLARVDELISSTKTAKQLLSMEHEGLSSPKEPGRIEDDCTDNLRNQCEDKHSGNLLKCILANDEQWTVILHNYVV